MPMTDSYIDVMLGDKSHRIQIRHEDRPCDAYIAVDGQQVSSRLKMLPYNGGAHYFEVDGHQLVLVIARSDSDQPWEYDCFVDDVSVVNGMPFWFGKADLVTVRRWEKSRRGGKINYWLVACAKGALIGCAIFFVLFVGGWIGRMDITWVHLVVSVVPLTALYAIFVPFEWKNNEAAYHQYLSYRSKGHSVADSGAEDAPAQTADVETSPDEAAGQPTEENPAP